MTGAPNPDDLERWKAEAAIFERMSAPADAFLVSAEEAHRRQLASIKELRAAGKPLLDSDIDWLIAIADGRTQPRSTTAADGDRP